MGAGAPVLEGRRIRVRGLVQGGFRPLSGIWRAIWGWRAMCAAMARGC
jgi:hypothetical protein